MLKTDLEYKKKTLCIRLNGYASIEEIHRLKQKIFFIINEYGITELKFYLKEAKNVDITMFEEFMPFCDFITQDKLNI